MTRDWIRPTILKKTHQRVKMYALRNEISDLRQAYDEVIEYALDSDGRLRKRWSQAVEAPKHKETTENRKLD